MITETNINNQLPIPIIRDILNSIIFSYSEKSIYRLPNFKTNVYNINSSDGNKNNSLLLKKQGHNNVDYVVIDLSLVCKRWAKEVIPFLNYPPVTINSKQDLLKYIRWKSQSKVWFPVQSIKDFDVHIVKPENFSVLLLKRGDLAPIHILPFVRSLIYYTPLDEHPDLNGDWIFKNLQTLKYTLHSDSNFENLELFLKQNPSINYLKLRLNKEFKQLGKKLVDPNINIQRVKIEILKPGLYNKAGGVLFDDPSFNGHVTRLSIGFKNYTETNFKELAQIVKYSPSPLKTLKIEGELNNDVVLFFNALAENSNILCLKTRFLHSSTSISTLSFHGSVSNLFKRNKTIKDFVWNGSVSLNEISCIGLIENQTIGSFQINYPHEGTFRNSSPMDQQMNEFILKNSNLTKFKALVSNDVFPAIQSHQYLTDIHVHGANAKLLVGPILSQCRSIKKLYVFSIDFGIDEDEDVEEVFDSQDFIIQAFRNNTTIQDLTLRGGFISLELVTSFINFHHQSLTSLSIDSQQENIWDSLLLVESLSTNTNLETFELVSRVDKYLEFLEPILTQNKTLQNLRFILYNFKFLVTSGNSEYIINKLIKILSSKQCSTLKTLNLNYFVTKIIKSSPKNPNLLLANVRNISVQLEDEHGY
eukprot:gene5303-6604_t